MCSFFTVLSEVKSTLLDDQFESMAIFALIYRATDFLWSPSLLDRVGLLKASFVSKTKGMHFFCLMHFLSLSFLLKVAHEWHLRRG